MPQCTCPQHYVRLSDPAEEKERTEEEIQIQFAATPVEAVNKSPGERTQEEIKVLNEGLHEAAVDLCIEWENNFKRQFYGRNYREHPQVLHFVNNFEVYPFAKELSVFFFTCWKDSGESVLDKRYVVFSTCVLDEMRRDLVDIYTTNQAENEIFIENVTDSDEDNHSFINMLM